MRSKQAELLIRRTHALGPAPEDLFLTGTRGSRGRRCGRAAPRRAAPGRAAPGGAAPGGFLYRSHDIGDALLFGSRLVGAFAKTFYTRGYELGPSSAEPPEVMLTDPGTQMEGGRCHRDRPCLEARLGHRSQLVVGVRQPR